MALTKALLIFCEGPHDVAYVSRVLKTLFGAKQNNKIRFNELPSPFAALFRTNVEKHALEDLTLDMARKFYLPDCILIKDEHLILPFNIGGRTKPEEVKTLLQNFLPLLAGSRIFQQGAPSSISEAKYLFLYDADHRTTRECIQWADKKFQTIENCPEWILDFSNLNETGNCSISSTGDKAIFVYAGESGKGTLEEILIPLCRSSQTVPIEKAEAFFNDAFVWNVDSAKADHAYAETAKFKKASLTAIGQREKPGSSLSVILSQTNIINDDSLKNDGASKAFAEFLSRFTGLAVES